MGNALKITIAVQFVRDTLSQWQIGYTTNPLLAETRMAVGFYNHSIYLIGGSSNPRRVCQHQWKTHTLSEIASDLDTDIYGGSAYWTQQQHILYLIPPGIPTEIATYNLDTHAFVSNIIQIPTDVDRYGCLTSAQDQTLFVVGGYNEVDGALNQIQILNLALYHMNTWNDDISLYSDNVTTPS
eukprot:424140_1